MLRGLLGSNATNIHAAVLIADNFDDLFKEPTGLSLQILENFHNHMYITLLPYFIKF